MTSPAQLTCALKIEYVTNVPAWLKYLNRDSEYSLKYHK